MKLFFCFIIGLIWASFLFGCNPTQFESTFSPSEIEPESKSDSPRQSDKLINRRVQKEIPSHYTLIALTERMVRFQWQEKRVIDAMPPIPLPREWSEMTPGNLGNSALFPGSLTDALGRRLPLTTSTSPQWLFKKPGTLGRVMVQIGMTAEIEASSPNDSSMWYRVSSDGGEIFSSFKPMIQTGRTAMSPFPGIKLGVNGIWASVATLTELSNGTLLVPVSYWPLDGRGLPTIPSYPTSYSVNAVLIGSWNSTKTDLSWRLSDRTMISEQLSTRGLIEPAVIELRDQPGRVLMISRGSNIHRPDLPSRKWKSVSNDYGMTWSAPSPFCYDTSACFYSPSSSSDLVRGPNGRIYWIGNIAGNNPSGNEPRNILVMSEVDEVKLALKLGTLTYLDSPSYQYDTQQVQIQGVSTYLDSASSSFVIYHRRLDPGLPPPYNAQNPPINWYRITFKDPATTPRPMFPIEL
jgi:hypothetical protein